MKNIKKISNLMLITALAIAGLVSSCKDDQLAEGIPYLFRPINFNVELNKTVATISWAKVDSAASYTLQVSEDSLFNSTKLVDTTITQLSFVKELAGETKFFARIRANAADTSMNSKFNSKLSFKTPKENLFDGFGTTINTGKKYSAYMTGVKTFTIKWQPGANVTHMILTSADKTYKDSVLISTPEATAGSKTVVVESNSTWTIKMYNNKILRGTTTGLIEGDVIVNTGEDIVTAINSASANQVIVLAPGAVYGLGGSTYRIGKNLKIRGLSPTSRSVICMTSGTPTSSASALGFVDGAIFDYLRFENIDFTGYCDNNTSAIKIGYLFNNNLAATVKAVTFNNCLIHNFGNTPMRIQGAKNQAIDTVAFNGCVINEIGFSSTYAIVNSNSADLFKNIIFNNCTVYNFKGSLVLRTGQTINSVSITNCTINQGMQDGGSARYLIDLNTATFTGGGVTIKNCILGQTGSTLGGNGLRYVAGTTVSNTGCYYTSDYVDDPIPAGATSSSIKSAMTVYSGLSTALWTSPTTGDFTLKDATFKGKGAAGDPRWY